MLLQAGRTNKEENILCTMSVTCLFRTNNPLLSWYWFVIEFLIYIPFKKGLKFSKKKKNSLSLKFSSISSNPNNLKLKNLKQKILSTSELVYLYWAFTCSLLLKIKLEHTVLQQLQLQENTGCYWFRVERLFLLSVPFGISSLLVSSAPSLGYMNQYENSGNWPLSNFLGLYPRSLARQPSLQLSGSSYVYFVYNLKDFYSYVVERMEISTFCLMRMETW